MKACKPRKPRAFFNFSAQLILGALALLITGCETDYAITQRSSVLANPDADPMNPTPPASTSVPTPTTIKVLTPHTDTFPLATSRSKQVDFLFMIDNSGSMADNQQALANGFAKFATTFYNRPDLDICTMIITSDRFLGRTGMNGYARERAIPCTQPVGSDSWTPNQRQAHIMNVIANFKSKANVGTAGSGTELGVKSMVAFLYDLDKWVSEFPLAGNASLKRNSFFRTGSVANVSFLSDENNFFFQPDISAAENDLPAYANEAIPGSATVDPRLGAKEYLDYFFKGSNQDQPLTYSVTSIIELSQPTHTVPGLALNLFDLPGKVGRESSRGDIRGGADEYAALYDKVGQGIIYRFDTFSTKSEIYEPKYPSVEHLKVTLQHAAEAGGGVRELFPGVDYDFAAPNGITVKKAVSDTFVVGDSLQVEYVWMKEVVAQ